MNIPKTYFCALGAALVRYCFKYFVFDYFIHFSVMLMSFNFHLYTEHNLYSKQPEVKKESLKSDIYCTLKLSQYILILYFTKATVELYPQ